jgi:hypothetical protein
MCSSDSELNVTPEGVWLVAEILNSKLLPEKSKGHSSITLNSGIKLIKSYSESALMNYAFHQRSHRVTKHLCHC